jgi:cytidine deaminase
MIEGSSLMPDDSTLVEAAQAAAENAYAPYSRFRVGAAVRGASGRIYEGCNVENASYPVGLCAERNALGSAVAAGEERIEAVAVASADASLETLLPCGMCRQFLSEFGDLRMLTKQAGRWVAQPLSTLLPAAFRLEQGE